MFNYFLQEYKYEIYRKKQNGLTNLPWYVLALLAAIIITLASIPILSFLKLNNWLAVSIVSLPILFIALNYFTDYYLKKNFKHRRQKYENTRLTLLILMLKNNNFYNIASIDWLIQCCDDEINSSVLFPKGSVKGFFLVVIYPFFSLLTGIFIKDVSSTDAVAFLAVIILFSMVFFAIYMVIQPVFESIFAPDKEIAKYLQSELRYIKTTL